MTDLANIELRILQRMDDSRQVLQQRRTYNTSPRGPWLDVETVFETEREYHERIGIDCTKSDESPCDGPSQDTDDLASRILDLEERLNDIAEMACSSYDR